MDKGDIILKDIKGYEGLYAVTPEGEVWSYQSKKFLKPITDKDGYLIITLYKDGQKKMHKIHRLVAMAYLPNPENLPQINHKDENKANNCLQNLEWCDCKYNINYGTRNEKIKKPILQYSLNGEFIREWPSATDVGKEVRCAIYDCIRGKQKTAINFIWKYKDNI